jgi:hypothetical protein
VYARPVDDRFLCRKPVFNTWDLAEPSASEECEAETSIMSVDNGILQMYGPDEMVSKLYKILLV